MKDHEFDEHRADQIGSSILMGGGAVMMVAAAVFGASEFGFHPLHRTLEILLFLGGLKLYSIGLRFTKESA